MAFIVTARCSNCGKRLTKKHNNLGINVCCGKCEEEWEEKVFKRREVKPNDTLQTQSIGLRG